MKACPHCAEKIKDEAIKCKHCKSDLVDRNKGTPDHHKKSKTTAVLLALFLGGVGAHKFYLDRSGQAIWYLLFCWTLIPALIALIEVFRLGFMSNEKFDRLYN